MDYFVVRLLIFGLLVACLKVPPVKLPQLSSSIPPVYMTQAQPIDLGDSRCTYGGTKFISWNDKGQIDGIYTEGQDTDYSEKVVCLALPSGNTTILTKPGDFKVIATDVVVGDTDCPQGGKKYESFIDVDGNNIYDSKIDTSYNSKKICNGLNGTASLSGANGVIITTTLATGNTQCPTGGTKLESFTDLNANGTYESGVDSFYNVKYTCNGSNSITLTSTIASGDATCPSGGTQINTFTDINNNGTYESTIDKNSNTYKVCNGQKALVLSTTLAVGDTTCPAGGTQLITCIDSNGDSNCTSGPDLNYATQKICNGPGAGFLVITENAGSNCKAGGYRLDRFQDNNNNAVYDVGTDTGYTSTYICNGLNWLSKSTSFTAGNGTVGDNTSCPVGGVRFEFGYDHVNSSNGAYNVGVDGVLDTVEIVVTATAYSCNGANSFAGPLISSFQNDSEGTKARFYWEIISADGTAPNVKLAYSSTKAGIQAWNCENTLAGVTVVTDFASCTDTSYRTAASGSLNSNAKCGFDLIAAPFSTAAWDYRYFKLCAQNTTSPNSQNITNFRVAGNVPSGMVMVHLDDWPIHEFANTNIVPFTYAIDKWENSLSSGSITNGTPGTCTSTNCISSSTGVLISVSGQTPVGAIDWYASRKGCSNRTAAGYTGANTPRTIHLNTEMEQFVANYGTPDNYFMGWGSQVTGGYSNAAVVSGYGNCNISLKHNAGDVTNDGNEYFLTGDVGTKNCISRYGSRDLIGNLAELLDGYYENLTSTTTRQKSIYWGTADKVTTVISDALLGYAVPTAAFTVYHVQDWDYQNLLPKTYLVNPYNSPNPKFFMDLFEFDGSVATKVVYAGYGGWSAGSSLGRFEKAFNLIPTGANAQVSVRCAIVSP
jgi:hypothetical protein